MHLIDSHIHLGRADFCQVKGVDFPSDLCNSYEETIALMDRYNVDKAIVLPVPHRLIDTSISNSYVYEAYQKYPDRFAPFCRIDNNITENLELGFCGAKLHLLYEDVKISAIKKQLQIIEDYCVPLILHAKFANKVRQVEDILKIAPNIIIILAHMGRGHIYTSEQVIQNALGLRKFPNVYMDTSTVGDLKAIINVCEIIGFDRVLFGSDYPFGKGYFSEQYNYLLEPNLIQESLPASDSERLLYKNAKALLEKREKLRIRRVKSSDRDSIISIFERITEEERKFLALNSKLSLIKQIIKSERHCYVAIDHSKVVGFLRESGRPEGVSLLEEIVTDPDCRDMGIATALLKYYLNAFPKSIAKTNAANKAMIHLCRKNGYFAENPEAKRIINWRREGED